MNVDISPRTLRGRGHLALLGLAAAVAGALLVPSVAHAQEVVVVEDGYRGPDWRAFSSGLFVFGGTYTASAVVAATSSHPGDQYLWAPIVGPWMDIANRCAGVGPCDSDTGRKVLLGFDGVFQGLGLLSMATSFFLPRRRGPRRAATETTFRVLPASYGRGTPGLTMVGTF